ncbi:MAG: chemotaxis protein CheX [Bryobacteraceae bacterium]
MVAESIIDVYRADMIQIVSGVFQTMVKLPVQQVEADWFPEPGRLTGVIYFAGQWRGAVLVELRPEQAFEITRRLGAPLPTSVNEDVIDALGELANMIGGNMKSVMPRGVGLSIPSVVEGPRYTLRICGDHSLARFAFASDIGQFWVTLVEMPEEE